MKDVMRTMMAAAGASTRVWRSAMKHAAFLWNRTHVSPRTGKTPLEVMTGKKPSLAHIGTFGCDAWYHAEKSERSTLEPKGRECVYLGHDAVQNCARVWCLQSKKVLARRDVRFAGPTATFQHMRVLAGGTTEKGDVDATTLTEPEYEIERISEMRQKPSGTQYRVHWRGYTEPTWEPRSGLEDTAALEAYEQQLLEQRQTPAAAETTVTAAAAAAPRRSPRLAATESKDDDSDDDDDGDDESDVEQRVEMVMSAISGVSRSVTSDTRRAVRVGVKRHRRVPASEPATTVKWKASRQAEIDACERQGVWEDVPINELPPEANVLPSKWVDKEKSDARLKSRITPKGFKQKKGLDYRETFASTALYKTLRVVLSLVALWGYELLQADVPEAFLNAELEETVYMQMPPGYERPGYVKRLKKSLYGLCQAPRNWGKLIHGFLMSELKYTPTESDPSLYWRRSRTGRLMLLYRFVDDVEGGYHEDDRAEFMEGIDQLKKRFNIKVLPTTDTILGMRLTRDRTARTIRLDLERYISDACDKYGLSQCKSAPTPMAVTRSSEQTEQEREPCDRQQYMEVTGTVMYAVCAARPDIAFAAHRLASAMQAPTNRDMVAAKRVLRYLSGTRSIGLVFGGKQGQPHSAAAAAGSRGHAAQQMSVCSLADAVWATDKEDRRSVTGWVAKLNGDLISWAAKKQRTVALSTCEAELYAEAAAIQEVLWLRGMLKELGLRVEAGSTVHGDNQSTIAVSQNGIKGERTKHIDVKYRFVTEVIERGDVRLQWVATTEQEADLFTKALAQPVHEKFRDALMSSATTTPTPLTSVSQQ